MSIITLLGATAFGLFMAIVSKDVIACLPTLQHWLLVRASRRMPPHRQEECLEAWLAELPNLAPSEIRRVFFALGCFKCARGEARRYSLPERHATQREIQERHIRTIKLHVGGKYKIVKYTYLCPDEQDTKWFMQSGVSVHQFKNKIILPWNNGEKPSITRWTSNWLNKLKREQ